MTFLKMNAATLFAIVASARLCSAGEWTAPEDVDPQVVLSEIRTDIREERYEIAFEKLDWFDENAVKIDPSLHGVKNSFALSHWCDLAKVHAPAKERVDQKRSVAIDDLATGDSTAGLSLLTIMAIDRRMGNPDLSVELFTAYAKANPTRATSIYPSVESSLIKAGQIELCGKYLDPRQRFRRAEMLLEMQLRRDQDERVSRLLRQHGINRYRNAVATTVAILKLNDRDDEAERYHRKAVEYWSEIAEEFDLRENALDKALNDALEGTIPQR